MSPFFNLHAISRNFYFVSKFGNLLFRDRAIFLQLVLISLLFPRLLFGDENPVYLIYLGAPGTGKGTQANIQAKIRELPYISVGALLREEVERETPLGIQMKRFMDRGILVPEEIALAALLQRLEQNDCKRGAVLDGTSRKLSHAQFLMDHLLPGSRVFVFYLEVPEEKLMERISLRAICPVCETSYHPIFAPERSQGICNLCDIPLIHRADDRLEVIQKRLEVFSEHKNSVLDFYETFKILYRIDGSLAPESVAAQINAILESRLGLENGNNRDLSQQPENSTYRRN